MPPSPADHAPAPAVETTCRFDHDRDGNCHVHPNGCAAFAALAQRENDLRTARLAARPLTDRLRPLNDQILIRQRPPTRTLGSGIIHAADAHKPWPPEGTVIAIGPGRFDPDTGARVPMSVEVGQRVVFERRPSSEIEGLRVGDDIRFLMMRDDDIVAVVEDIADDATAVASSGYGMHQLHGRDSLR